MLLANADDAENNAANHSASISLIAILCRQRFIGPSSVHRFPVSPPLPDLQPSVMIPSDFYTWRDAAR
jgi:hypothetical protein